MKKTGLASKPCYLLLFGMDILKWDTEPWTLAIGIGTVPESWPVSVCHCGYIKKSNLDFGLISEHTFEGQADMFQDNMELPQLNNNEALRKHFTCLDSQAMHPKATAGVVVARKFSSFRKVSICCLWVLGVCVCVRFHNTSWELVHRCVARQHIS